ncbi:EspA/EspE family type VII secretion system effector [Mycobacterium montefiorense]|uniref:ESX-1 secretion-associated protein EspA/EspE-like domain-containing protein n=1 Tax=Mycobacterium montefiorense TaxID=154654 RepID=A0AA37PKY4_9MYCO|nr:EspA/EspE family type VII secretion system effector [Mycobacterium montefiorense]GBG39278.1 hypothetical protein MmonteBS_36500 [Mycobacterium montefiorense]GKU37696.1 hypothetical protein NJB14191_50420 [Mycobacterium montefiorense]GKU41901.1 hypothetical protein NJB14192_38840 [Mycobacterium montefiorense]GKU45642.1 hypothetical protein NJB14194_22630 [Mycobacterium montefiorense]GKU53401.1 hypothetical protein NJB14195_46420 [Mycobacterium montefiorense]
MSIFADAARLLSNLANVGSQFIGLDANLMPSTSDSGAGGEYLAGSVTGMTGGLGSSLSSGQILGGIFKPADALATWDRNANLGSQDLRQKYSADMYYKPAHRLQVARNGERTSNVKPAGAAVNILPWTASVIGYLELLLGFGPPNEGDDLEVGAQLWSTLRDELASAIPNEDWQGEASDTYAGQVAAVQDIAQTLAELDGQLAEIVVEQAEWVTHIRLGFGILLNLLTTAIVIEVALRIALAMVPGGPAWAMGWAILASSLAMAAALGMLGALTGLSVENGKKAHHVTSEINRLGEAATQLVNESMAHSVGSVAPQSRVSEFQAPPQGTPTTFAGPTGGQPTQPKMTKARSEYEQFGASATPHSPQGEDAECDEKQNVTIPALDESMRMLKQQGPNYSGQAPRRAGSRNPVIGEKRQLDAAEADGAAAGTDAVDRAPIDRELRQGVNEKLAQATSGLNRDTEAYADATADRRHSPGRVYSATIQ